MNRVTDSGVVGPQGISKSNGKTGGLIDLPIEERYETIDAALRSGCAKVGTVPLWGYQDPPPLKWVVEGLIPEGFVTVLAADGGTGKSFLAMYLGIMIALSRSFFGLAVQPGKVLYVDYELDAVAQRRRQLSILRGLGLDQHHEALQGRMFYCRPQRSLSTAGGHDDVIKAIEVHGIDLVILDSLTIGMGADASSQEDVTRVMQRFKDWGTVFAIDHISGSASRGNHSRARPFGSVFKRNIARSTFTLAQADAGGHMLTADKNNFGSQQDLLCYSIDFDDENELVRFRQIDHNDDEMKGALQHMSSMEVTLCAIKTLSNSSGKGVSPEDVQKWREEHESPIASGTIRNHFTALRKKGRLELLGDGTARPSSPLHEGPQDDGQNRAELAQNSDSRFTPPIGSVNRESSGDGAAVDVKFEMDDEAPF